MAFISLSEQAGADTETQGHGQVINVVRKRTAKVNGTYEATIVAGIRYGFQPSLNTSATMRRGDTSYELNFSSYSERVYGFGPKDFKTASGGLVERRPYTGKGGHDEDTEVKCPPRAIILPVRAFCFQIEAILASFGFDPYCPLPRWQS